MATVAIFHALDVDPILRMLVFGESILNDAISIVLTTTITQSAHSDAFDKASTGEAIASALKTFCAMFFASAGIGVVFALISALLLKHVDLRKNPSLEFAMMLMFTYAPYVLAEVSEYYLQFTKQFFILMLTGNPSKWNYGHSFLWYCYVALYPFQSLYGYTNHYATDHAYIGFYC